MYINEHIIVADSKNNKKIKLKTMHRYEWKSTRCLCMDEIVCFMMDKLHMDKRTDEYEYVLATDNNECVISLMEIGRGTQTSVSSNLLSMFQYLFLIGAYGFYLVHNHPSDSCEPSENDKISHIKIKQSAKDVGLKLIESIIISRDGYSLIGENSGRRSIFAEDDDMAEN